MKSSPLLLGLALLGLAACQSNTQPADADVAAGLAGRATAEGTVYSVPADRLFRADEGDMTDQAPETLQQLAEQLRKQNPRQLIVRSYTGSRGDDQKNIALTQRRAQTVATWLREHGVEAPAEVQGMGEASPVAPDTKADGAEDPTAQAQNRRVEVVVMK